MKITISSTARISLEEIIDFLKRRWTKKEINTLKNDIKKFRKIINDGIVKNQSLENFPKIQFMLICKKQVKILYEIKGNEVVVKLFWYCKQDPQKLRDLLK